MSKKKMALVVSHQYWPTPGSASQVLGALVRELMADDLEVSVLTNAAAERGRGEQQGPHGERVLAVAGPETSGVSLKRIVDLAKFAWAVWRHSRRESPDVVISDAPPTAAWVAERVARRKGVPFVYYFSDSWGAASLGAQSQFARLANGVLTAIENGALRRSHLVVAVTSEMVELAGNAGAKNIIEVRNGVDTLELQGDDLWYPSADERDFFLYAGNAGVVHGAEVFLRASELLWERGESFDLVFMGYGVTHVDALAVKERWGDRMVVLDNQPTHRVAAAFRASAGALSSLRPNPAYAHARPMKSLTGAACGAPAIYAGEGDFAEVIAENGLGFVSDWSPEGAATSMKQALELQSSSKRGVRRSAIRDYALAHFDERVGAKRVVDAVQDLLNGTTLAAQAENHDGRDA